MTPIDYIRIDSDILRLQVSDKAKLLLGLVKSFNNKGLMMSNSEIGKLLNCSRDNIRRLLKEIEKYIRIENPQSRYRKIFYSNTDARVEAKLLEPTGPTKEDSTRTSEHATRTHLHAYSNPQARHNIKNTNNTIYTTFSFSLRGGNGDLWYLSEVKLNSYLEAYKGVDVERELRKAAQWLIDNPQRRKTAKGMPRFLNGWLTRAKPTPSQEYATRDCTEEEAEELMKEVTA